MVPVRHSLQHIQNEHIDGGADIHRMIVVAAALVQEHHHLFSTIAVKFPAPAFVHHLIHKRTEGLHDIIGQVVGIVSAAVVDAEPGRIAVRGDAPAHRAADDAVAIVQHGIEFIISMAAKIFAKQGMKIVFGKEALALLPLFGDEGIGAAGHILLRHQAGTHQQLRLPEDLHANNAPPYPGFVLFCPRGLIHQHAGGIVMLPPAKGLGGRHVFPVAEEHRDIFLCQHHHGSSRQRNGRVMDDDSADLLQCDARIFIIIQHQPVFLHRDVIGMVQHYGTPAAHSCSSGLMAVFCFTGR